MTIAVLGTYVPPPPPPPLNPGWERMRVHWFGGDGSEWSLHDPEGGVFLMRGGIRGLGMRKPKHYRDESPAVYGSFWRGLTYESEEVFWPIYLYSDVSTREYVELDRAWWRSLNPERTGIWEIEIPGVSRRHLHLRFKDDGDWSPDLDPTFVGWAQYGIRLTADQPLWEEAEPLRRVFEPDPPVPFHGGTTPGAAVINISSGRSVATASVTNPGDVEAWPTWTFEGPLDEDGAMVTVDGHDIDVPFAVLAGDKVVVDTRPTEQTATLVHANGTTEDVFTQLGTFDPAPIQAGDAADLTLLLRAGTGKIVLEMVPLYLRAW